MSLPDCPMYTPLHVLHCNLYMPLGLLLSPFSVSRWEAMFIRTYLQDGTLITEQQVNEYNPLFELMNRKHLIAQSPTS